jgi:hypothetical protein
MQFAVYIILMLKTIPYKREGEGEMERNEEEKANTGVKSCI